MPKFALSKTEEKLMDFLWEQNKPLSAFEVLNLLNDSSWGEHYIRVILNSLEKKGAVECCGFEQRVNQYARRFRCTLTKEEYYVQLAEKGGVDMKKVFRLTAVAMVKKCSEKEKEELIQKLEEIIEEFRKKDEEEEEKKS